MSSHISHNACSCCIANLFHPPLPPRPNPNSSSTANTSVTSSSSCPFSSSSPSNSHDDSTPLPFPISKSFPEDGEKDKTTLVVEKVGVEEEEEKEKDGMKRKVPEDAMKSGKACPPPITLLRNLQNGKPYSFVRYDEESKKQVVDEIKIPKGGLFQDQREDGILKLSIKNFSEKEEEKDE